MSKIKDSSIKQKLCLTLFHKKCLICHFNDHKNHLAVPLKWRLKSSTNYRAPTGMECWAISSNIHCFYDTANLLLMIHLSLGSWWHHGVLVVFGGINKYMLWKQIVMFLLKLNIKNPQQDIIIKSAIMSWPYRWSKRTDFLLKLKLASRTNFTRVCKRQRDLWMVNFG